MSLFSHPQYLTYPDILLYILGQSGIVQLLWEAGTAVVYTCSLDGVVRLWDARTGRLLTDYRGHTAEILDFALSKYVKWERAGWDHCIWKVGLA